MAKYVATKDCYGFRLRSWKKGETVDVKEGERAPSQFTLIKEAGKPPADTPPNDETAEKGKKGRKGKGE